MGLVKLAVMNALDDIRADGTATLWIMKDGAELNEQVECTDIAGMLNSRELFDLLVGSGEILIRRSRMRPYCIGQE